MNGRQIPHRAMWGGYADTKEVRQAPLLGRTTDL